MRPCFTDIRRCKNFIINWMVLPPTVNSTNKSVYFSHGKSPALLSAAWNANLLSKIYDLFIFVFPPTCAPPGKRYWCVGEYIRRWCLIFFYLAACLQTHNHTGTRTEEWVPQGWVWPASIQAWVCEPCLARVIHLYKTYTDFDLGVDRQISLRRNPEKFGRNIQPPLCSVYS